MKESVIVGVAAGLVIIAGVFGFQYFSASPKASVAAMYEVPEFADTYTNDEYDFSLRLPQGFSAREILIEDPTTTIIVLEDGNENGIQIVITPFTEDLAEFTEARIRASAPHMVVSNPLPIKMGKQNRGFAFTSNSEAFDGTSSEVWFVFNGRLYQLSTYSRLDPLLKAIFSTWRFF